MTSNFSASIPVANMQAANAFLAGTDGDPLNTNNYGPNNFSVPAYAGPTASVALLHAWGDPAFEAAVASIPDVVITQGTDPIEMTTEAADSAGSTWGTDAKPLTGTVTPGLYKDAASVLWWVIQSYDTAIWSDPTAIPALVRRAKVPGQADPWVQPLDQYDAYKLVNPFTSEGDLCTHNGSTWQVTQADGAGNNIWEPGVYGWSNIGPATQILLNLDGDQYDDTVVAQVGNVTITEDADSYDIDLNGDGIADLHIPKP